MFHVERTDQKKRPWIPRTRHPAFKELEPGQKLYPVDEATARSFTTGAKKRGWTVWRKRISDTEYEIGREA